MDASIVEANFFKSKPRSGESSSEFMVRMERGRSVH